MTTDIELIPMTEAYFERFVARAINSYAAENVAAGRWPADGAEQRSVKAFAQLLPEGLATAGHCLYEIQVADHGVVGGLWYALLEEGGRRQVHVYDVLIAPQYRRRGHAAAAFREMESRLRCEGVDEIGLHVFAHNPGAQALYRSLGYNVVSVNMLKAL